MDSHVIHEQEYKYVSLLIYLFQIFFQRFHVWQIYHICCLYKKFLQIISADHYNWEIN